MRSIILFCILILTIEFTFGQSDRPQTCPEDSMQVDSVYITEIAFQKKLEKRLIKYKLERKIVLLDFSYEHHKNDSILTLSMSNKNDDGFSIEIRSHRAYGYFYIDSVLFLIDSSNVPKMLFKFSNKNRLFYTEENKCKSITMGKVNDFECTYKIKVTRNEMKFHEVNESIYTCKLVLRSLYLSFINLFKSKN